jgi:hypothetical protein
MIVARRVYQYGIAFAAVWMLVNGLAGLLEVLIESIVATILPPVTSIGSSGLANRVSFSGALAGIGLITWVIHWGLALRAVSRDPLGERRSAIRKLYLYGVLLVGGLILTYEVRQLVFDVLGLLFGSVSGTDFLNGDVASPLSMLLATGAFWLYHLRLADRDRQAVPEVGAGATLRRWCVYLLAFVGLLMLLFGVSNLLARAGEMTLPHAGVQLDTGRWLALDVAGRVASILTGLLVWVTAWTWSTRQFHRTVGGDLERESTLRKVYLYGVLLFAISWTVWNIGQMLYVLVYSALVPSEAGELWNDIQRDLSETIGHVVVFGVAWAYHARVITRESAAAPERHRQASIRWIYGYLVAVVGAVTFASGLGGTLGTLLDLLVRPGVPHSEHWWQERISLFATLMVVGLPVWLLPWMRLQREVVASVARRSLARRIYLFLVLGVTVLTLLGTGAYTLYQVLRVALGETWTASNTSDLLEAASAAAVAGLMLGYHLRVFQHDAALARQDEESEAAEATSTTGTAAAGTLAPNQAGAAVVSAADSVTLLVIRAADDAQAAELRAQVAAALPDGSTVETVRLPAAEAARLLPPPA